MERFPHLNNNRNYREVAMYVAGVAVFVVQAADLAAVEPYASRTISGT